MVNQPLPTSTATAAATPTATHSPAATITPQHSATPAPGQMALQARYFYDGDGNLVKSVVDGVVTYYPGRHYHKTVDGEAVTIKKYYSIGMQQIAVRTIEGESETIHWILTDHLSSASVIANADGTIYSEVRYSAFGEVRYQSGSLPNGYTYRASTLEGHRSVEPDERGGWIIEQQFQSLAIFWKSQQTSSFGPQRSQSAGLC